MGVPGDTYRAIKWFIQRGKRGYSDSDVWNLEYHIAKVMIGALKDLKKQVHGVPCGMSGVQDIEVDDVDSEAMIKWKGIIRELIWLFESIQKINEHDWIYVADEKDRIELQDYVERLNLPRCEEDKVFHSLDIPVKKYYLMSIEDCKRYREGWKLFQEYYFDLWD